MNNDGETIILVISLIKELLNLKIKNVERMDFSIKRINDDSDNEKVTTFDQVMTLYLYLRCLSF